MAQASALRAMFHETMLTCTPYLSAAGQRDEAE
jgi:hypothetical protein